MLDSSDIQRAFPAIGGVVFLDIGRVASPSLVVWSPLYLESCLPCHLQSGLPFVSLFGGVISPDSGGVAFPVIG